MQAAINAARADLPASLKTNPTYRKVNPADAPILILALTSKTLTRGPDLRRGEQRPGAAAVAVERHRPSHHRRLGAACRSRRPQSASAFQIRHRPRRRPRGVGLRQRQQPERLDRRRRQPLSDLYQRSGHQSRRLYAAGGRLSQRRGGPTDRRRDGQRFGRGFAQSRHVQRSTVGTGHPVPPARRQHHRHHRQHQERIAAFGGGNAGGRQRDDRHRPQHHHSPIAARHRSDVGDRRHLGHHGRLLLPAQFQRHHDSVRGGAGVDPRHFRRDVSVGLQSRHPVADGAHHLHRLRGRRRDRRAGKHIAPYRGRHAARAGGVPRRARGRIHGAVDQPVADRRVHSYFADGRHPRPAISRIHADAVAGDPDFVGDLADHHADDVRAVLARPRGAARHSAPQFFRPDARRLRAHARLGVGSQQARALDLLRRDRAQRLAVLRRAEGIFPAAGHRTADRLPASRPKRLVQADDAKAAADGGDRAAGSGGAKRRRLYRRGQRRRLRPDQYRIGVRLAQADLAAAADRPSDRAAAAEARPSPRRPAVFISGPGYPRRRPSKRRAISIHASVRQRRAISTSGRRGWSRRWNTIR